MSVRCVTDLTDGNVVDSPRLTEGAWRIVDYHIKQASIPGHHASLIADEGLSTVEASLSIGLLVRDRCVDVAAQGRPS